MVGNIQPDNSGDILVELDENNIIVVDPNKTIDNFGNIRERLVDHENLVMYANLECNVVPRTKLAVGGNPADRLQTISVAKMNFLKPTKNSYLGTGYYDELTGGNVSKFSGENQKSELPPQSNNGNNAYVSETPDKQREIIDTGLLGITSINVVTNTSFVPQVEILLEDIQGKALFELGDGSPYSAFFNMPYPPFYLTLKGYYGQAIRYQLNLTDFNASFNGFSGNYLVRLKFVGYKFNILGEISMGHLLATPHMYSQRFDITQTVDGPQQPNKATESQSSTQAEKGANDLGSNEGVVTQLVAEKGYQKIVEVYSEYKSKGLIEPNFPELTLVQLMTKLENFESAITNSFDKADVEPLTNIRNYKGILTQYFDTIIGPNNSWFNIYLNPNPIVLYSGQKVYFFKELSRDVKDTAISQLQKDINEFNNALAENKTLGVRGESPIPNPINFGTLKLDTLTSADINWRETTRIQTGISNPTTQDELNLKSQLSFLFVPTELEIPTNPVGLISTLVSLANAKLVPREFFIFEGEGRFDKEMALLDAQANKKLSEFESKITALLLRKIEDTNIGLGFKPTVRNMIAVVMASAEGFIRLMDDCHTNAWNVKYDPIRKRAILENQSPAPSSDAVENTPRNRFTLINENQLDSNAINSQEPVYPWPQFSVESTDDKNKFQLKYIADPSVVDLTQGYLFDKWPEVEFVEEYLKGLTQKFQNPNVAPAIDNERNTNIININPIEFPSTGLAYTNKEEIKFFYEIWERQFLTSHYSGFIRANSNQVGQLIELNTEIEGNNIVSQLGISSPYLSLKLKNFNLTAVNYPEFLFGISNLGTGRAYQEYLRDFFVTPYIKTITENSFEILSTLDIGKIPQVSSESDALKSLVVNASNEPLIVDTLPYTNQTWCLNNLNQGNTAVLNQVYNTNKSLTIFEQRKIISNFTDVYDFSKNRPVTNFSYVLNQNPSIFPSVFGLNSFYLSRTPNNFAATEGYIDGTTPTGFIGPRSTTSMLNTPFFINSIQNGVYNSRFSGNEYPYVQAAYLFLNSLPLATLREKYKSQSNNITTDLDYISSALKKFGAIHKLPYAWILKYGSIWHRYKKYKETNVDILESSWKNFNYEENYYPPTSSTTKVYFFDYEGSTKSIQLQSEDNTQIQMQVGFYPKLINDFNFFYNGFDLYQEYTDQEIQNSVNGGMKIYNFSSSNINNAKQGDKNIRLSTWSVVLPNLTPDLPIDCNPKDNTKDDDYFVIPSFGTLFNQTVESCVSSQTTIPETKVNLTNNSNVYNGSVRCLWAAPNFGYFDSNQLSVPQPDSYLNFITSENNQTPLHFLTEDKYTKIEEVFSVFEKKILDSFEVEFLNFCRPMTNAIVGRETKTFGQSLVDSNSNFKNFQSLFKSLMTVPTKTKNETEEQYFTNTIGNQFLLFQNGIKSFMEYDIIFKYGNPSNYNRRIFDSYLSHNNTTVVVDPIPFNPYVTNSLPSAGGTVLLSQSQINNQTAWLSLETEVGFSTIPNVNYSSNGSYITDFFIDNNIAFTSENVTLLAPIIKMYATQKLNNPNLNAQQFQNQLTQYLRREVDIQNNFLDGVLSRLRSNKGLPNQQQLPERAISSRISGGQSKVELYEVFKAINDKWIAGADYNTKTLFEDILFLDRASRNVGDSIIIDIFALKNMFNKTSLNQAMSVFVFISEILMSNNFNVMPLPAYVNFYGTQDVDGTITPKTPGKAEFANNLWGSFLNVDYRNSSSKLVCTYAGKPSQYLNLPKNNFKFKNDAFDITRSSGNPLIENQQGKKDWALSNKCVGFNVDVGIRNQNIFYSLTVSQDNGVATSEAINQILNISDQASGRQVSTQNNGLYNLYKQRSYKSTVTSLGNALLQPMMYFNLRHVPMFDGAYMITSVNHTIQPGNFQTVFDGQRMGYFDLPPIDSFLQSINDNLITKIEDLLKINKDQVRISTSTNNVKATEVVQTADNTLGTTNSCSSKITAPVYLNANPGYEAVTGILSGFTETELSEALKRLFPNNSDLQTIIYCICYIRTFQTNANTNIGTFNGWNFNLATLSLDVDWGGQVSEFEKGKYTCVNIKTTPSSNSSQPLVHFNSLDSFLRFMAGRIMERIPQVKQLGLAKYYVCHWPKDNVSEEYYDSNVGEFKQTLDTFTKALASAVRTGLAQFQDAAAEKKKIDDVQKEGRTPGVTPTPTQLPPNFGQTCPPPVVSTFSPSAGYTGTIVQVNGRNFESLKSITVAGQNVDINNITVFNSETLQFILPAITIPEGRDVVNGKIIVTTEFGTSGSSVNFTFNPELQNVTMSSPGGLANTSVTEVTSVSQQDRIGSDLNPQNIGAVPLVVSTETKSALGGNEILTITVNPEAGSWVIDDTPSFSYDYKVNQTQNNSNSTILTTTTYEGNNKTLEGYVSSDGQTFSIDREDFINSQFDIDREEFKDVSLRINTMIYLRATPLDKEKNPKNFERQYPFEIVIPPSAPPNPARIIEVSNVNDFNLPSLRGQNFYNIEKPNGGYITFEFVCENVIVKQSPKVFSIPQNIEQAITVQNSGNTKYTNLITLRSLGQFQLGIPFEVSQYPGITFTARSQIFIL
jgi:hypothetical protein